jgi:hypothetical protein
MKVKVSMKEMGKRIEDAVANSRFVSTIEDLKIQLRPATMTVNKEDGTTQECIPYYRKLDEIARYTFVGIVTGVTSLCASAAVIVPDIPTKIIMTACSVGTGYVSLSGIKSLIRHEPLLVEPPENFSGYY